MSATTVTPVATACVATVRFGDADDAKAFVDRVTTRGATFPVFAAAAADAYGRGSSQTYAVVSTVDRAGLPETTGMIGLGTPALVGPYATGSGWEVAQILSIRP